MIQETILTFTYCCLHIFKNFAYFILHREKNEIDAFLKPFVDSFSSTEETASFIGELVIAEDYLNKYEQFLAYLGQSDIQK